MEQYVQLLTDLLKKVFVNPPTVRLIDKDCLVAEEYSIGVSQVQQQSLTRTVVKDAFQVYNPVGEEIGPEFTQFSMAAKKLIKVIATERMNTLLDDLATDAMAKEWNESKQGIVPKPTH